MRKSVRRKEAGPWGKGAGVGRTPSEGERVLPGLQLPRHEHLVHDVEVELLGPPERLGRGAAAASAGAAGEAGGGAVAVEARERRLELGAVAGDLAHAAQRRAVVACPAANGRSVR